MNMIMAIDETIKMSWRPVNGRIEDELIFLVRYREDVQPTPEYDDTVKQYGNPIHAVRYLLLAHH
jgi:hypothetical protein